MTSSASPFTMNAYYDYSDAALAEVGIPHDLNVYSSPNAYRDVVKVHAPVPLPQQSSLLYTDFQIPGGYPEPQQEQFVEGPPLDAATRALCEPQDMPINPDFCASDFTQATFPTPSELLEEIAAQGLSPTRDDMGSDGSDMRSETARKARRRAMAEIVGFLPTDPDSISSHDKKRHYLECLEQYIAYLHEQYALVGEEPPEMDRVGTYRGLSSRSIRTLLVHMEHNTRSLNLRTVSEEQRFIALRDEIYRRDPNIVRHK